VEFGSDSEASAAEAEDGSEECQEADPSAELGRDSEASGRFLPAAEGEDSGEECRDADPSAAPLGIQLLQGLQKLGFRHPTARH